MVGTQVALRNAHGWRMTEQGDPRIAITAVNVSHVQHCSRTRRQKSSQLYVLYVQLGWLVPVTNSHNVLYIHNYKPNTPQNCMYIHMLIKQPTLARKKRERSYKGLHSGLTMTNYYACIL